MNRSGKPALSRSAFSCYYDIESGLGRLVSQLFHFFHGGRISYKSCKSRLPLFVRNIRLLFCPFFNFGGKGIYLPGYVFSNLVVLNKNIDTVIRAVFLYPYQMAVHHPPVNFIHTFKMGPVFSFHNLFKCAQEHISVQYLLCSHTHRRQKLIDLTGNVFPCKSLSAKQSSGFFASVSVALGLKKLYIPRQPVYCNHVSDTLQVVHMVFLAVNNHAHPAVFKVY